MILFTKKMKWLSCKAVQPSSKPHTAQTNNIISCNCVLTYETGEVSNDRPSIEFDRSETVKWTKSDNEY